MYASVRHYQTYVVTEFADRLRDEFLPLIREEPGFVAYYGVDVGGGEFVSVSVFETQEQADASNERANQWVKGAAAPFIVAEPKVVVGPVVASFA